MFLLITLCRKLNNPLNNIAFVWKKSRERFRERDVKKSTWGLHEYVHPVLSVSKRLTVCTMKYPSPCFIGDSPLREEL